MGARRSRDPSDGERVAADGPAAQEDTASLLETALSEASPPLDSALASLFEPEFLGFERGVSGDRFAIHARAERAVELELFELGAAAPFRTVDLVPDPVAPAPWMLWTADLDELPAEFEYAVRVDGGPRLLDPYAPLLAGGEIWGRSQDALAPGVGRAYRGLVVDDEFDWRGVEPPQVDPERRVVYELHVRGFTRSPSSGVSRPGSLLGLIEKIPYLVELGVTTVELMPLFEFDETANPRTNPANGERLVNFWGYSPVSFFAPKAGFASEPLPGAVRQELKELVRELHRAGLEVVLDVVYNHTAEGAGGSLDPVIGFRALDEAGYYLLDGARREPIDLTGCGNTVNCNHPVTRRLIVDSLRHWSEEYRVDGFRFDLAGVFFRNAVGMKVARSPIVEQIAADPVIGRRWLSAEPWDATGFTPENGFPLPWQVWDGELRDALRSFAGGLAGDPRPLARRLAGLGAQGGRMPAERSVRFVACHDGLPLADVVAYERKHNEANGEGNHDGWSGEVSWNGGVEGESDDPKLLAVRERQVKLLAALWAATPGTLLLGCGDERLRTQSGNNNAWCQDNEIGWIDWTPDERGEAFRRLVRGLLELRRASLLGPGARRSALVEPYLAGAEGPAGGAAFLMVHSAGVAEPSWIVAANPGAAAAQFPLPVSVQGRRWRLRLDTARPSGQELFAGDGAPFLAYETTHLAVAPRSLRILAAEEFSAAIRGEA